MTHRWTGRFWSALIAVAVAASVSAVAIASSSADSGSGSLGQVEFPTTAAMREAERAAREAYEAAQARRATPEARAARVRSRSAYRGLGRAEALALAERAFSGVFGHRSFEPVELPEGAHIETFLGSTGALVEGGGEKQLIEAAGVPLTSTVGSGERELVDMSLRPVDGGFESRNPVTPLQITDTGGAELDEWGLQVSVDGVARDVDAIEEKGRVFLADALPDTDLVVEPAPAGVSYGFQLRSVDAPEQATLSFDLPAGTTLRRGSGSDADTVELVDAGDKVIAHVDAPVAWDADGESVPVHYELDGARVRVVVLHRGRDVHYPLYVDPLIEYTGVYPYSLGWPWAWTSTNSWDHVLGDPLRIANKNVADNGSVPRWYSTGEYGSYYYDNPRGYIAKLEGFYVSHRNPLATCAYMGVRGGSNTYWKGGAPWTHCGGADGVTPILNQSPVVNTNDFSYGDRATFWLKITTGGNRWQVTDLLARGVKYTFEDTEYPVITSTVPNDTNGAWTDGGVVVTASPVGHDLGLGMHRFTWTLPDGSTATSWVTKTGTASQTSSGGCSGVYGNRCPIGDVTGAIKVNTDDLDEGDNTYTIKAYDRLDKSSGTGRTTRVKVDRSAPTFSAFSGPLWDIRGRLVSTPQDLGITFSDPHSGLDWTQFLIDGEPAGFQDLTCGTGAECPTKTAPRTLSFDPAELADGQHTIDAQARDGLGHELSTVDSFDVLVDNAAPSTPALTHSGQPSGWTDSATATVSATTSDSSTAPTGDWGSGIERLELLDGDDVIASKDYTCTDTLTGRCLESETHAFDYTAAEDPPAGTVQLEEGDRTLRIDAYDKAGWSSSSSTWHAKVDRSAPDLTLTGDLWDLANREVAPGSYSLHADAADPYSGAKSIDVLVDDTSVVPAEELEQPCPDGGCAISRDWTFDTTEFGPGPHTVTVIAEDELGHASEEEFTVALDEEGPSITLQHSNQPPAGWAASYDDLLTVAAEDAGTGVAEIEVTKGETPQTVTNDCLSAAPNSCPSNLDEEFPLGAFQEGETTVRVVARDGAGNESPPEELTVKVDEHEPELADLDPHGLGADSTLHGEATWGVDAADALSGVGSIRALIDGAADLPGAGPLTVQCEDDCHGASGEVILRSDELPAGPHSLTFELTDHVGRTTTSSEIEFQVDGRPYSSTRPRVVGRAYDGATLTADDGTWRSSSPMTSERQWQRCTPEGSDCEDIAGETASTYVAGPEDVGRTVRFSLAVSNAAGTASASAPARLVPAAPAPDVAIETDSPASFGSWIGPGPLTATVTATDPAIDEGSGVAAVDLGVDGQPLAPEGPCDPQALCPEETRFALDAAALSEGTHELHASATDTTDVTSQATHTVTLDKSAPAVNLGGELAQAAGIEPGTHLLTIAADEPTSPVSAQSGVTQLEIRVDGELALHETVSCPLGACSLARNFVYDTERWGPGTHDIDVVAADRVGNETTSTLHVRTGCDAAPAAPTPGDSEPVTLAEAEEVIAAHHESVLLPSNEVTVEGETYQPTLIESPDVLVGDQTMTPVEIARGPAGEVVVGQGPTSLCLTPAATTEVATPADVVNEDGHEDAALAANTAVGTDTLVRPVVDGVETFLSIRNPDAPEVTSWNVTAGDVELREQPDGSIQIVDPTPPLVDVPDGSVSTIRTEEQLEEAKAAGTVIPDAELPDPVEDAETAAAPSEAGVLFDASLDDIAEADAASPEPPSEGEEDPNPEADPDAGASELIAELDAQIEEESRQELEELEADAAVATAALNEQAEEAVRAQLEPLVLATIHPPTAVDANGESVPAAISTDGDTLTLTVDHDNPATQYPVLADPWISGTKTVTKTVNVPVYVKKTVVVNRTSSWEFEKKANGAKLVTRHTAACLVNGWCQYRHNGAWHRTQNEDKLTRVEILKRKPTYGEKKVFDHYNKEDTQVEVRTHTWQDDDPALRDPAHSGLLLDRDGAKVQLTFNEPADGCNPPAAPPQHPWQCDAPLPGCAYQPGEAVCKDRTVLDEFIHLIERTPPGPKEDGTCTGWPNSIKVTMLKLTDLPVINALRDAIADCVKVQLILNGDNDLATIAPPDTATDDALEDLKTQLEAGGNYVRCKENDGPCVAHGGIMHTKLALFSRVNINHDDPALECEGFTDAASMGCEEEVEVTWVSSSNPVTDQTRKFQNSVTVFGHHELYDKVASHLWKPMFKEQGYFKDGQGAFDVPGLRMQFIPSPFPSLDQDPVKQALDEIQSDKKCEITMMQSMFLQAREAIAKRLKQLGEGPDTTTRCALKLGVSWGDLNDEDIGDPNEQITSEVARVNKSSMPDEFITNYFTKIDSRVLRRTRYIHDKVMLATWYQGGKQRYMVLTGSHNLTKSAVRYNDELILRINSDKQIYNEFMAHWRKIRFSQRTIGLEG